MTTAELLTAIQVAQGRGEHLLAYEHALALVASLKVDARGVDARLRNYLGVPDEDLRREVEPAWNALSDELDVAYYQHWRRGQSRPFQGYDLLNQDGFNKLSAAIDLSRTVALHDASEALPVGDERRIPDRRRLDPDGRPVRTVAAEKLAALAIEGFVVTPPQPRII